MFLSSGTFVVLCSAKQRLNKDRLLRLAHDVGMNFALMSSTKHYVCEVYRKDNEMACTTRIA